MNEQNGVLRPINGRAVLGLDVDGVIADYAGGLRPYAASDFGVIADGLPEPDIYSIVDAWPFSDYAHYRRVHRAAVEAGLYRSLPLIPGAAEAIRELSTAGVHVRIVTHRLFIGGQHARVVSDTVAWLEKHRIPYMSLCFTGLKDSVGAHVYVEDSPANIAALREEGWPVFVADQKYNREVDGPRITDWSEGVGQIIGFLREHGQLR
ncbi:5' nucleotidase, NT5C type [uncultured Corynebacterium sp.]|uniref:5' nucleotidase, NT5C type n=1 Tax=uncultured Corynebacterium sp. TaxID=159447 RepID=UPI0025DA684A|nr:hypothetical protein [uncultured Corynebacterium sp.]